MNDNASGIHDPSPILKIYQAPLATAADSPFREIEETPRRFDDHVGAEDYWAGRTLAGRLSARIAA